MILQIIYCVFCPSNPRAIVIQEKALSRQAVLPRLMASHFPPAGLAGGYPEEFSMNEAVLA